MSHILIADDDKDLVEGLRWYLEADGFQVSAVNDGTAALEAARAQLPDLIILDIMMPGMDGVQVCQTIRQESEVYIMMLSARDAEIDKVRALSLGADDYMTKPFHVGELVARVKALLRRAGGAKRDVSVYRYEGLEVLLEERKVTVDGAPVDLTSMEFDLLVTLMRRPRVVFSREQLVEAVWGGDFYGELRLVDNHVYRLREKLAKAGMADCHIATVRGAGYAFRPEG